MPRFHFGILQSDVLGKLYLWFTVSDVNCTITCNEDFYLDEAVGYCRPHCGRWEAYPSTLQPVRDALVIISAACGIIAGIAVIVLAYFRHRTV